MKDESGNVQGRLCCVEGECFRNDIIEAFESEWDEYILPDVVYGPHDMYLLHKGAMYYYKPRLQQLYDEDQIVLEADKSDTRRQESLRAVNEYLGFDFTADRISPEFIKQLIKASPAGLPRYIAQSASFYKFYDVCETKITIDDLTPEVLNLIKTTFTSDYNPLLNNLADGLWMKDGQLYFTDISRWSNNPNVKLGAFFDPIDSTLYDNAVDRAFFFPFNILTAEEQSFVDTFGALETDYANIDTIYL